MKRLPTLPLEFARPSGNRFDVDASSRRGVPMPLQQTTTTRACCSLQVAAAIEVEHARSARPSSPTVISFTRAHVVEPRAGSIAFGQ